MSRILLVEDDASFRMLLSVALTHEGHTVDEARTGVEAMKILKAEPPDLVITDLLMPEKDGIETIIEMKQFDPKIRIIAMSGGGREHAETYLKVAHSLGALRILSKPFELETLKKEIQAALA